MLDSGIFGAELLSADCDAGEIRVGVVHLTVLVSLPSLTPVNAISYKPVKAERNLMIVFSDILTL